MPDSPLNPVFLVGPLRSGTTLLRLMLDRHPGIHWPSEFEFGIALDGRAPWKSAAHYRSFLEVDRAFHDSRLKLRATEAKSADEITRDFLEQYREATRALGKQVLGLTIHTNFAHALSLWPNAKFIHLLRDPRDVAKSAQGMLWAGNVHEGARYWLDPEQQWDAMLPNLAREQFMELRYEHLVQNPVEELTRICTFVGLPYDDRMLSYHEDSTYEPVDASAASRWRTSLTEFEIRSVEARCGALLAARGYEPSGLRPLSFGPFGKWWIYTDHRVRRALSQAKWMGPRLWLQWVISQRIGSKSWRNSVQLRVNEFYRKRVR